MDVQYITFFLAHHSSFLIVYNALVSAERSSTRPRRRADCAAPEASGEGDFRSAGSGNAGGGGCSGPPPPGAADDGWVYPGVPMEDLDAEVAAQKKKAPVPPSPQRAEHGLDDDADAAHVLLSITMQRSRSVRGHRPMSRSASCSRGSLRSARRSRASRTSPQ